MSQVSVLDLLREASPLTLGVLLILLVFSVVSWAIIFSKWNSFRQARTANGGFLRAFRDANGLEAAVAVGKRFRQAPLTGVFVFGFEEVDRQVRSRGKLTRPLGGGHSGMLGLQRWDRQPVLGAHALRFRR